AVHLTRCERGPRFEFRQTNLITALMQKNCYDFRMDVELTRTFLEIVSTRSFIRATERLNVSQTTVSARIRSLEERLGRPLFIRNQAGASLTPAGEQFLRFAPNMLQLWDRARHQVAVPEGRKAILAMGGELSLWHPLMLDW